MKTLVRLLIAFLAVSGVVALLNVYFGIQFGHTDYWDYHGVFFLIFIAAFPRLTLLLSSVATGGLIWWLGWLFAPRILVASLATIEYWDRNPVLVLFAWLMAFSGESSEKLVVLRGARNRASGGRGYDAAKWVDSK